MEQLIDVDEYEERINNLEDPNKKTWINEAVLRNMLGTLLYCGIAIVGFAITIPWGIDVDTLIVGFKLVIIPVVVVGFKAMLNERLVKQKRTMQEEADRLKEEIDCLKATISDQNIEINKLRSELDVKCQLIEALKEAREKAENEFRRNSS